MELTGRNLVLAISGSIISLTLIIIFGVSFATLEPNEVGLEYNSFTMKLNEDELYDAGRYMLGPSHSFIKFPTNAQYLTFDGSEDGGAAITVRSNEGVEITVNIALQYEFDATLESMLDLYLTFGDDYEDTFKLAIANAVRDAAANYETAAFYANRTAVSEDFFIYVESSLASDHAILLNLQVTNILFPSDYEEAIEDTQIARQDVLQAGFEKDEAIVVAETTILIAQEEALIIGFEANASAGEIVFEAQAAAEETALSVEADISAFQQIRDSLGLSSNQDLLTYMWISSLGESDASNIVLEVSKPANLGNP